MASKQSTKCKGRLVEFNNRTTIRQSMIKILMHGYGKQPLLKTATKNYFPTLNRIFIFNSPKATTVNISILKVTVKDICVVACCWLIHKDIHK